jgi:hypothetical protein
MEDAQPDATERLVGTLLKMEEAGADRDVHEKAAILAALVRIADTLVALSGTVHPATMQDREDLTKRVMASIGAVRTAIDTIIITPAKGGGNEE